MAAIAEREVLLALIETIKAKPVARENIRASVRVTGEVLDLLLGRLKIEGLISESDGFVTASSKQRLGIAVSAVEAGADLARVGRALGWLEFEEMVAHIFEENGYRARRRFRFEGKGRRWEIDVLASRQPLIVCAECKHWLKGMGNSAAAKTVKTHVEKVLVFSENLAELAVKLDLEGWGRGVVVPIAMSLTRTPMRFYDRIPIVSILELPSFLSDVEGYLGDLVSFAVRLPPPKPKPFQTTLRK